ncbi:MAG: SRPBCC family protein [Acidimicrobiia bacterium]
MTAHLKPQPQAPLTRPIRVSTDVIISAPIDSVFAFVSDLRHTPTWNRAIVTTDALSVGPIRRGSRYLQTRTVPRHSQEIVEITTFEPNRLLELVSDEEGAGVRYGYEFEAVNDYETRVTMTVTLQPDHPVGRRDLYRQRLVRIMASNLVHLRTAIRSALRGNADA